MAHSVRLSDDGTYIILKIEGGFKGKDMLAYILESHALGRESGVNRYLVDVTEARNVDTVAANYRFAYSDMKNVEGIDPYAKVVTLISPGDHSHDFIETVMSNAGTPLKCFTDLESALEYLLKD